MVWLGVASLICCCLLFAAKLIECLSGCHYTLSGFVRGQDIA